MKVESTSIAPAKYHKNKQHCESCVFSAPFSLAEISRIELYKWCELDFDAPLVISKLMQFATLGVT